MKAATSALQRGSQAGAQTPENRVADQLVEGGGRWCWAPASVATSGGSVVREAVLGDLHARPASAGSS